MPCKRIILKWEVWPSSVVQSVRLSPYLMWGQLQHLLLACRHDEGYLATGSYENEDENENTEDRSKDPIYIQVRQGMDQTLWCQHLLIIKSLPFMSQKIITKKHFIIPDRFLQGFPCPQACLNQWLLGVIYYLWRQLCLM